MSTGLGSVTSIVARLLAPLRRQVRLMVARGVVELVKDSTRAQVLQLSVQAGVLEDGVERFQEYGLTSRPAPGAEALVVHIGGDTAHGIVVAVEDRRYRPRDLAEGEVALYTLQGGKRVHARDDGHVDLGTSPTDEVALAPLCHDELEKIAGEFAKIATTLSSLSGQATFGTPYSNGYTTVGSVAAEEVRAK